MMHKAMNGFTVVAHEHNPAAGLYWILGSRRTGPGTYEYVVAGVQNFDVDNQWVTSGFYTSNFNSAVEAFNGKVGI
jgi:hypothetical protein